MPPDSQEHFLLTLLFTPLMLFNGFVTKILRIFTDTMQLHSTYMSRKRNYPLFNTNCTRELSADYRSRVLYAIKKRDARFFIVGGYFPR